MKSKKHLRVTAKPAEEHKVNVSSTTVPFRQIAANGKFSLPYDSDGLQLGVLTKRNTAGSGQFSGNACSAEGNAIFVGSRVQVEPVA